MENWKSLKTESRYNKLLPFISRILRTVLISLRSEGRILIGVSFVSWQFNRHRRTELFNENLIKIKYRYESRKAYRKTPPAEWKYMHLYIRVHMYMASFNAFVTITMTRMQMDCKSFLLQEKESDTESDGIIQEANCQIRCECGYDHVYGSVGPKTDATFVPPVLDRNTGIPLPYPNHDVEFYKPDPPDRYPAVLQLSVQEQWMLSSDRYLTNAYIIDSGIYLLQ